MDGANILALVGVRQPCGSVPPKTRVFGKRIEGVAAGRRPAENRCYVKKFTYDVIFFTYDVTFFT